MLCRYALTPYNLSFVVPSNLSFAQAASIPIPFFTAVQALYFRLGLPEPPSGSVKTPEPILIWSGASAVGQYAIQLAKLTGLEVVTTAGEASRDLVKGLGATEAFDYKARLPPYLLQSGMMGVAGELMSGFPIG
jgi:NADPH:quinone reductase-like Zn-dependent oxidoreductase